MTIPAIVCQLNVQPATSPPVWIDISQWLRAPWATTRGRSRLTRTQAQFETGTATVTLDNRDRRFDPTNTAGPYYPNLRPNNMIRVAAVAETVTLNLWTGYVDAWPPVWPGFAEANVTVTCSDIFDVLANWEMSTSTYRADVLNPQPYIPAAPTCYYRLGDTGGGPGAFYGFTDEQGGPIATVFGDVQGGQTGALQVDADPAISVSQDQGNAYLLLPASAGISGTGAFTIAFWWQAGNLTVGTTYVLYEQPWTVAGSPRVSITLTPLATGNATLEARIGPTILDATVLYDNEWHLTMFTRDGAGHTYLYFDTGALLNVLTGPTTTQTIVAGPAYLGYCQRDQGTAGFEGLFDELAIWNGAAPASSSDGQSMWWLMYRDAQPFNLAQYTGQRISTILSMIDIPDYETTGYTLISTGWTFLTADPQNYAGETVLQFCQQHEQEEQGQFHVNPEGQVVFRDRYWRWWGTQRASKATFGDTAADTYKYDQGGFAPSYDKTELYNGITVTPTGGLPQTVFDQTSQDTYFQRSVLGGLSNVDVYQTVDAYQLGGWILADTKDPILAVDDLVLDVRAVNPNDLAVLLGLDIGDVVTVRKTQIPGGGDPIEQLCRFEGVDHAGADDKSWKMTIHLSTSNVTGWLVCDDPVAGVLDDGNLVGWSGFILAY